MGDLDHSSCCALRHLPKQWQSTNQLRQNDEQLHQRLSQSNSKKLRIGHKHIQGWLLDLHMQVKSVKSRERLVAKSLESSTASSVFFLQLQWNGNRAGTEWEQDGNQAVAAKLSRKRNWNYGTETEPEPERNRSKIRTELARNWRTRNGTRTGTKLERNRNRNRTRTKPEWKQNRTGTEPEP